MTTHIQRRLRAMQANLIHTADAIADLWRGLPTGRANEADPVVLAIFAGAAGVSIATALALIATTPR